MTKYISKDDRIFVSGHLGMAGSSICRALKRKGYANLLVASRQDLDLRDLNAVVQWFEKNKPDVVILAAAKVGGIIANSTFPADFLFDNLKIQSNIIETSWMKSIKRLLFLGSSCIYPKHAIQPIKEEYLLSGLLEPTNEWYAIAKIAGIKQCSALKIQHGFDAISIMPTNLYGTGDNYHLFNSHVLPAFIRRFNEAVDEKKEEVICFGSGKPLREFLHVDDLGDAAVFCLENFKPQNDDIHFLNIGTGSDISIKELAMKIATLVGFKGRIIWDKSKPDGTPKKNLDVSRINNLGWQSKISLEEGLQKTIDDFRNINSANRL